MIRYLKYILITILSSFVSVGVSQTAELDYDTVAQLSADSISGLLHMAADRQSDSEEVIRYMTILMGKCSSSSDPKELRLAVKTSVELGEILFRKEHYAEAFRFMLQGVNIAENNGIALYLPTLYKNIGNIYSVYGDSKMAINSYEKALELARQQNDKDVEIRTLCNLAGVCAAVCRLDEAKLYHDDMMSIGQDYPPMRYLGYITEALMAKCQSDSAASIKGLKNAEHYALSNNFEPKYVAYAYSELANFFLQCNMLDSAEFYFEKNRDFCDKNNLIYEQQPNLKALISLYKQRGEVEKAVEMRNLYYFMQDSLMAVESYTRIKENEIISEMEKNYFRISELSHETMIKSAKISNQRIVLFVVLVSLAIMSAAVIAIELQRRKLNRANRHLYNRNVELLDKTRKYDSLLKTHISLKEKTADLNRNAYSENHSPDIRRNEEQYDSVALNLPEEQVDRIKKAILQIMDNPEIYCSNDFSLDRLAELVDCNVKYVSLVINGTQQKNFRTFLNEYRINEASKRLMDKKYDNLTIKAIGEELGFKSYSNFIETFRKITGMTPSDFRKISLSNSD